MSRWWLDRSLRAKGLLVLALPLAMLILAAAVFFFAGAQADSAQRHVNHTRQVDSDLNLAGLLLVDGETGIRAYLATGDRKFLEPTVDARGRLPETLQRLERLSVDDPAQEQRLARVRQEVARGLQTRPPSDVAPGSGRQALRAWLVEQKASTDRIRSLLAEMGDAEESRLADAVRTRDEWRRRARIGTGVALAVGGAAGVLGMIGFTLGIARRLERLEIGSEQARHGRVPALVDPGGDEIGVLSRRLDEVTTRWLLWQGEAMSARQSAEQASRAKNEFLSRMSHELRTPLNAVLGFAQLLEMDLPDGQREPAAQIRRAGRHLLDLINEVLDISRIEGGHLALSPETVNVGDLVEEAVELLGPLATDAGVTLRADAAAARTIHVRADRQRAKQVLLNLLSNAVKYNRPGGSVSVRCRQTDSAAAIEVEDTGLGIDKADIARLFVPFERLSAATSGIEGTGVGLALSQRLATAMDGRIDVRSTAGEGSTFTLVLPATTDRPEARIPQQPGAQPGAQPQPGRTAAPDPAAGPARTVLSIEDNPANTRLLQEIVARRTDWSLVTAAEARLGLELAAADPPQLILLDLHLPDLPGLQVLRRLRSTPATAHVPVVVVSADATPGLVKRLRAAGASGYMTKPIDVAAILGLLDEVPVEAGPEEPPRRA